MSKIASAVLALVFVLGALAVPARPALAAPPGPSLVEVALAVNSSGPYAGQFDTLIGAVLAADPAVVNTLSGNGQFTVFAPTDDAFAALGLTPANIGTALPQEALTDILLYHVARGRRGAVEVVAADQLRMLNGSFLQQSGGVLTDNQGRTARIIVTDVPAGNGIIHVIDAVVLP